MHFLDVAAILCIGLMIGNEFAVSAFVNPVIWQLEEHAQAKALGLFAHLLGKVMPFWYAACLLLMGVEAYLRRHEGMLVLLLIAMAIWAMTIVYTIAVLVPINNRIAKLGAVLPERWREEHASWDSYHRWRVLLLVVAMACFVYGVVGAH